MPEMYRQLILCPDDADWIPASLADLQDALQQTGLLGDKFADTVNEQRISQHYYVGEHFLQHINFMGCAPAVEFLPVDGDIDKRDSFIFLNLIESYAEPHWLADLNMARPACPDCKKRFANAQQQLDIPTQNLTCPHCNTVASAASYDWKEFGGAARTLVSIVNAYPKETIPSANLLAQLKQHSGTAWSYFYYFGELLK